MGKLQLELGNLDGKVIVEAGHIYTSEQPNQEHYVGVEIGLQLAKVFQALEMETENWLFIDNYNPKLEGQEEILVLDDYVSYLGKVGLKPKKIIYESDFLKKAQENLDELVDEGFTYEQKGKIILGKGKVTLFENGKYFCPLLDACAYQQKLKQADYCVTVLPENYKQQQKDTSIILKKLGINFCHIFPYFYSSQKEDLLQNALQLVKTVNQLSGEIK